MRKCAVIIGVGKTESMQYLPGAAAGAREFAEWAESNGFETSLHVDDVDNKSVTISTVNKATKSFVDKGVFELMIVYFSGHGVMRSPGEELWLLSDALDNPAEVINLNTSSTYSRSFGIGHVVFISDACRSIPDKISLTTMTGNPILNYQEQDTDLVPTVDIFYATRPGSMALEVKQEETKGYSSIYTDCLLPALKGNVPELVVKRQIPYIEQYGVFSRDLEPYLRKEVPRIAKEKKLRHIQHPVGIIASLNPQWISEIPKTHLIDTNGDKVTGEIGSDQHYNETDNFLEEISQFIDGPPPTIKNTYPRFYFYGELESIDISDFPSRYRFNTVKGQLQTIILDKSTTFLLKFCTGLSTPLAVLSGFNAKVLIQGGRVSNIQYIPIKGTQRFRHMLLDRDKLLKRQKAVAIAAYNGRLRAEEDSNYLKNLANFIRATKAYDPILGLYAAYAYTIAGDFKDTASVFRYMRDEPEPILFDVDLLRRFTDNTPTHDIAPVCPMFTQGWAFLQNFRDRYPLQLSELSSEILPGLWTTFTRRGTEIFQIQETHKYK